MIRSVLTLQARPGAVEPVLELFRSQQILQESLDLTRALASEISVATDGTGEILVSAVWPDEAAYQEWIDHPNRGRTSSELAVLLNDAGITAARLYAVDHSVTKPRLCA